MSDLQSLVKQLGALTEEIAAAHCPSLDDGALDKTLEVLKTPAPIAAPVPPPSLEDSSLLDTITTRP